ncbi:hypothetical protein Tco_1538132 [Tanacetum coccineum]
MTKAVPAPSMDPPNTRDESSYGISDLNSIVNSFFTSTPSKPSTTSTPLPVATPDARTQELINKKLKKAKELGTNAQPQHTIDTEEDTEKD